MTHRERALAVLEGRAPDRVPWFADLDYWTTAKIARGELSQDFKRSREYIDWHEELGCGFYLQGHFPFRAVGEGYAVEEGRSDGTGNSGRHAAHRFRTITTPLGTLRERHRYLEGSFSEAAVEHLVETPADLAPYRFVAEHTRYVADYEWAEKRREQIGDRGILVVYTPRTPFMHLLAVDAGLENVMSTMMEAPEELDETISAMRKSSDPAAALAAESPADAVMIPENLSAEMVGPAFFERYLRGPQTAWSRTIRRAGKHSCIHMDGTLRGLLREECSVGLSFIDACTPAPVGDVPVRDWPEYTEGTETVLWGGIPGGYFTDSVEDAEFDRHVIEVLEVMRRAPRYVLGVADQVPPDGLERRVRRVAELVERHGRYE